jgi:hypothetical protein
MFRDPRTEDTRALLEAVHQPVHRDGIDRHLAVAIALKDTRWLLGEKNASPGADRWRDAGTSVSSRFTDRTSSSRYGEALLPLAPTKTLVSPLRLKAANWLVPKQIGRHLYRA